MTRRPAIEVFRIATIASLLLFSAGCPRDAEKSVTIVLRGEPNLSAQIAEHLATTLTDDGGWSHMSWSQWGRETTLTLAPIDNPEDLRQRVGFGSVTRIEGRTVYVEVHRVHATAAVILARNKEIFRDLFPNLFPSVSP